MSPRTPGILEGAWRLRRIRGTSGHGRSSGIDDLRTHPAARALALACRVASVWACVIAGVVRVDAQTRGTTVLRNVASVSALDALGNPIAAVSPAALTPVDLVAALDLAPPGAASVRPGTFAEYRHTLAHQGNYVESYDLSTTSLRGWSVDLETVAFARAESNPPPVSATLRIGPLAPGDSARVLVRVHCPADAVPGQEETTTLVARAVRMPVESRGVLDRTRVAAAAFDPFGIVVQPNGPVPPGAQLAYRIEFGNPDPSQDLVGLVISDTLPTGLDPPLAWSQGALADATVLGRSVWVDAAHDAVSGVVTWSFAPLPPGFRSTLALDARVEETAPEGLRIVNRAWATAQGLPLLASGAVTTTVVPPYLELEIQALTTTAAPGEPALFRVEVRNGSLVRDLEGVEVEFRVPQGLRLLQQPTSGSGLGKAAGVLPQAASSLRLAVARLGPGERRQWSVACAVSEFAFPGPRRANATARASTLGDVQLETEAEAMLDVRTGLGLTGAVLGRVYIDEDGDGKPSEHEGLPNVRVELETGASCISDGRGRFHLEGIRPGLHVLRLDRSGLPADLEFATEGRLAAGNDRTRFVEIGPGEVHKVHFAAHRASTTPARRYEIAIGRETWRVHDFSLFDADSTRLSAGGLRFLREITATSAFASTDSLRARLLAARLDPLVTCDSIAVRIRVAPGRLEAPLAEARRVAIAVALGSASPLEDAAPDPPALPLDKRILDMPGEPAILEPENGATARRDRITVLVRVPLGTVHRLHVNGDAVGESLVGERVEAPGRGIACWRYVGVPLRAGENHLLLEVGTGAERTALASRVRLAGPPARLELAPESTPADGRSEALVHVRVTDALGLPVTEAMLTVEAEGGVAGDDADPRRDGFQLRIVEGSGTVHLPAANEPGERWVRLRCGALTAETRARIRHEPHPWRMTGVGEVSMASRPDGQPLSADEAPQGAFARGGFLAQGNVGQSGLLTVGCDSQRDVEARFGERDAETMFPVLGDAASQSAATPTSWPVFARLDLASGHAQVGDFRTGWNESELALYDRALTGFDAAWLASSGRARVQGFAATLQQGAARDEIPGRGTSGPFTLRLRPLVVHGERVVLETRDRHHPERVLMARPLVRQVDYSIDYAHGTLVLRDALPSTDAAWNPMWLVVHYETPEARAATPIYGLRSSAVLVSGLRTGAGIVQEDALVRRRSLWSADAAWSLRPGLGLEGEFARSESERRGDAVRIALRGAIGPVRNTHLYYRDIGVDFDNPARSGGFETGSRRYGFEAETSAGTGARVGLDAYVHEDMRRDTRRHVVGADYRRDLRRWSTLLGAAQTGERSAAGSGQGGLVSAGARRQIGSRFGLEAGFQQSLGHVLATHPTRLSLGADARLSQRIGLRLRQEWDGDGTGRRATLLGLESRLAEASSFTSRYEHLDGADGARASAHVGLRTAVPLGGGWSLSAAAEEGRILTEAASTSALSLGTEYRESRRQASLQYEASRAGALLQHGLRFGSSLRLGPDWVLVGRERWTWSRVAGIATSQHDLWLGGVYRPVRRDALYAVLSLRAVVRPQMGVEAGTSRTVLALETSTDLERRWTLLGGIAARRAAVAADGIAAALTTQLTHVRLLYEPFDRVDFGFGLRHRARTGAAADWSYGIETGYRVMRDLRAVAGYNFAGFVDPDLPEREHSGHAGYVALRFKFDERLLGSILAP